MPAERKSRKRPKSLKKSKKMEEVKPLVTTGRHYSAATLYVRKSG